MELDLSHPVVVWMIRILSFTILMLTIYATATIFKSIWFKLWSSRTMSDKEKREFYVSKKYDIKWPLCFMVATLLGCVIFQLNYRSDLAILNLICSLLFGLLWWGNYRTLNIERRRLELREKII